ncbi:Caffeic acid 3-O-methyltransferase-like protein [Drosera capensis]
MPIVSDLEKTPRTNAEGDEAGIYASHVALSFTVLPILKAAIELNLLDIIAAEGPKFLSAAEVAAKLKSMNTEAATIIDRMLRLLASHSLLQSFPRKGKDGDDQDVVERVYGIAPAGRFFVKSQDDGSLATILLLGCHPVTWEVWSGLKDVVLEGGDIYQRVHGMSLFQYMNKDPTFNKIFNVAMADYSVMTMKKILDTYKGFEGLTSMVDVGGGIGTSLSMIVAKYPSIKGVNYDLPHVVKHAPAYPGIEHIGGDMFVNVPKGETLMIKCALHNWNDEQCLDILKNCYNALPETGKLIVIDFVLPTEPDGSWADKHVTELDTIMLVTLGGQERTMKEFESLCKKSGFSGFEFICYAHTTGVMEFHK